MRWLGSAPILALVLAACECGARPPRTEPEPSPEALAPVTSVPAGPRAFDGAPSWAQDVETTRVTVDRQASTVPQIRDAARLLEPLVHTPSTDTRGVLLCRVMVTELRRWDASGLFALNTPPDVTTYIRIAGIEPELRVHLPEDAHEGVLSVPNVTMDEGVSLGLRVVDRDLAVDDPIGEASGPWLPSFALDTEAFDVQCRLLPYAQVTPLASSALTRADGALSRLEATPSTIDLVRAPRAAFEVTGDARISIRDAASYVGYVHPDVARLLERLARIEESIRARFRESVVRAYGEAQAPGAPVTLSSAIRVVVHPEQCVEDARLGPRCFLSVDATYDNVPYPPAYRPTLEAMLIEEAGPGRLCLMPGDAAPAPRTAGTSKLRFECPITRVPDADAKIVLHLRDGDRAALARLR